MNITKVQQEILGKLLEGEWARLAYAMDKEATEEGKDRIRKLQKELDTLYYSINPAQVDQSDIQG